MNASHPRAERERLDHQRARLEHILTDEILSPATHEKLRQLRDDIARKLEALPPPWDADRTLGRRDSGGGPH